MASGEVVGGDFGMSERKLASVQRITAIAPIEGADAIECASVLGWKVVVKKGQFKVGDLAVYLEIDSVPPDAEPYRFLWKNTEMRPNNFRIKTIRLRGQISQGILFPVEVDGIEGDDVTETLGVTKYEAPLPRGSDDIEGQFFDGVSKTDEERVQSAEGAKRLESLRGRSFYITTKCDGASMTVAQHDGVTKVASRNYRLADVEGSSYWGAARNSGLIAFIDEMPWLAAQGELVGPGIQNNRLGLKSHECRVFNIYDLEDGTFLDLGMMLSLSIMFGFQLVPVLEHGHLFNYDQEQLLQLAEGKYVGTSNEREGIVIRSNGTGPRVSFKAISNRFLLKGGE